MKFKKIISKKSYITIVLAVFFMFLSTAVQPAFAASPQIYSVDINISLNDDGTAHITEVWDVKVVSGTEWYLVQGNLGDIQIYDFSVRDENGVYITEPTWNVDRTIEEKAGRCGMVAAGDGYELCWGVGSYGDHVFTVSYTMSNFVKGFEDFDGFNQRVLNDELSSVPGKVTVTVEKPGRPFTPDDTLIWGFGFEGEVWVEDGKIVASSDNMRSSSHVTVMARFEHGIFAPTSMRSGSFQAMYDLAIENSSYSLYEENGDKLPGGTALVIIFGSLGGAILLVRIVWSAISNNLPHGMTPAAKKYYTENFGYKSLPDLRVRVGADETRVPFGGSVPAAVRAMTHMGFMFSSESIMSAYLMKWVGEGRVKTDKQPVTTRKSLNPRLYECMIFNPDFSGIPPEETELYRLFLSLADEEYRVWTHKLSGYLSELSQGLTELHTQILACGTEIMLNRGYMVSVPRSGFMASDKVMTEYLTEEGYRAVEGAYAFLNYLENVVKSHSMQGIELEFWGDYLTFATLLGLSDKLIRWAERYDGSGYFTSYYGSYYFHTCRSIRKFSNTYVSKSSPSSSGGGGGGFSSSGGGGGSSGGGSGGGSR